MYRFDYSLCDVMNAGVVKFIIIGLVRISVVKATTSLHLVRCCQSQK